MSPRGSDGPSNAAIARAFAAISGVLLLGLVGGGFLFVRVSRDRDAAEEMQQVAEMRLRDAGLSVTAASSRRSIQPAAGPASRLSDPERERLVTAIRELQGRVDELMQASAAPRLAATPPDAPGDPSASAAERGRLAATIRDLEKKLDELAKAKAPPPEAADPIAEGFKRALESAVASLVEPAAKIDAAMVSRGFEGLTGKEVTQLLAPLLRDPKTCVGALRFAAAHSGIKLGPLVRELAATGRTDPAFRAAATSTFVAIARRGAIDDLLREASAPDLGPALGVPLLAAAAQVQVPGSPAAVASGLSRSPEEWKLATSLLLDQGTDGREALETALGGGKLSADASLFVIEALLPEAAAAEGPRLGQAILAHDEGVAVALAARISPDAAPGIAAELLAVNLTKERQALLAHALGLDSKAPKPRCLEAAFEKAEIAEHVQKIARDRGRAKPASGEELQQRAEEAEPLDVPDLLESLDLVPPLERCEPAATVAALGHPEGLAVLRRLSCHFDPAVRAAVVAAVAKARVTRAEALLAGLLGDDDPEVASAAAAAIDHLELPLDHGRGAAALAALDSPYSDFVLSAMARGGSKDAVTSVIVDALDRGAVREVYMAAAFVMRTHADEGPEYAAKFLGHRDPLVRTAALNAIPKPDEQSRGAWESVFERLSADPDAVVRAAAARGLGKIRDDLARTRLVVMVRDPAWIVREAALIGLSTQERVHVVPVLRRAQNDPEPFVANAARVALVKLGAQDTGPVLVQDLGDPAFGGRTKAALLGLIGARDLDEAALAAEVERLAGASSRPGRR